MHRPSYPSVLCLIFGSLSALHLTHNLIGVLHLTTEAFFYLETLD